MEPRNIGDVIDRVKAELPMDHPMLIQLDHLMTSVRYTPPEQMRMRWGQLRAAAAPVLRNILTRVGSADASTQIVDRRQPNTSQPRSLGQRPKSQTSDENGSAKFADWKVSHGGRHTKT